MSLEIPQEFLKEILGYSARSSLGIFQEISRKFFLEFLWNSWSSPSEILSGVSRKFTEKFIGNSSWSFKKMYFKSSLGCPPVWLHESLQDFPGIFSRVFFRKFPKKLLDYISTGCTEIPTKFLPKFLGYSARSFSRISLKIPQESSWRSSGILPGVSPQVTFW